MFNSKFLLVIAFFASPALVFAQSAEEKGLEIAKAADAYDQGFTDFTANMVMTLKNKKGETSSRLIRIRTLEVEGDGDKSLSIFDEPADVKGTKMLTYSHGLEPDDQWLYLPALKKVKRISSRNKSGPFMGSTFAYEDLGSQEVEKYTYRYLRDEACGEWTCHVIERFPAYKFSGYTRQIAWIDTEGYRLVRAEFYDRKKALLKTLTAGDFKQYLGHYWRPGTMDMVNHQTGKSTLLEWKDYEFKTGLTERDFRSQTLKRIK
ncbi:MAG: outer membrane lipoprotein-sorting protein [Gammaproteobacteria bacterium]|nr:MAG: outer membrane lipoprotein-sorting protein [Gammaproteobacteria bacterium]UCH38533.1 MAG: outer membrane lipoprotein-sorting protein [Gammaproteobacteria bacterium]